MLRKNWRVQLLSYNFRKDVFVMKHNKPLSVEFGNMSRFTHAFYE